MCLLHVVTRTSPITVAFAGNSLLCRSALLHNGIDAATFTSVRLVSGAITLWLLARGLPTALRGAGSWTSALRGIVQEVDSCCRTRKLA